MKINNYVKGLIIFFVLIVTLIGAIATEQYSTDTKGNFTVAWNLIEDKSSSKDYYLNISNNDAVSHNFDVQIMQDVSKGIIELYEYKNISKSKWYYNLTCVSYNETVNATDYTLTNCTDSGYSYNVYVFDWQKTSLISVTGNQPYKHNFGDMTIPANDYKYFRVELSNLSSINYVINLSVKDLNTGNTYHPLITSSLYSADFQNDISNATCWLGDNFIRPEITNFSTSAFMYHNFDDSNHTGGTTGGTSNDFLSPSGGRALVFETGGSEPQFDNVTCNNNNLKECVTFTSVVNSVKVLDNRSLNHVFNNWTVLFWMNANFYSSCAPFQSVTGFFALHSGGAQSSQGDKSIHMNYFNASSNLVCQIVPFDGASGGSSFFLAANIGNGGLNTSQDYFMACRKDGNTLSVWLDGQELNSLVASLPQMDLTNAGARATLGAYNLFIGARTGNGYQCSGLNGRMDEFQVYDRALSDQEILDLFNSGLGRRPSQNTCFIESSTFNTGQNDISFTPIYTCNPAQASCILNVTVEGVLYPDLADNIAVTLTPATSDGNSTFNYTIQLNSNMTALNISFAAFADSPPSKPILSTPANGSVVERAITLFSWVNSTDPDNDTINYTLNIFNSSGFQVFVNTTLDNNLFVDLTNVTTFSLDNYTWNVKATANTLSNFSFNFTFTLINATIITVINGTGNFTCIVQDDVCIDGVFRCLLAVNNQTGQELLSSRDAFDIRCQSLNIGSTGLRFFFFGLAFILIIIGFALRPPVFILSFLGGLLGLIFSIAMFFQFQSISLALIFTFGGIAFFSIARSVE